MFSLQKLLGKEDTFFNLFENALKEARNCSAGLLQVIANPDEPRHLEAISSARQKNKQTCEEISSVLVGTFVTALEREDIEALANIFYRMPKPIEKFAHRFRMAHQFVPDVDFKPQAEIIVRAIEIVSEMLSTLRRNGTQIDMRALNSRLQMAEAEADDLENRLLKMLYADRNSALRVLIVKDLYEILEKAVDRCRDAGNLINHTLLKNS